jgi:hypothetical protein
MFWVVSALAVPPEQLPPGEPLRALVGEHWRVIFPEGARDFAERAGWRLADAWRDQPWEGRHTVVINASSVDAQRQLGGKIFPNPWLTAQWTGTRPAPLPGMRPALVTHEWRPDGDAIDALLHRDLGRRHGWEGAWGLGASLAWPSWYLEARANGLVAGGDPTYGWIDRGDGLPPLSFDAAIMGSYRRVTPGPRLVGRMLAAPNPAAAVAAGNLATGPLIIVPGSLSFAWRATTGVGLRRAWRAAADQASAPPTVGEVIPDRSRDPAILASPQPTGDGAVVAFRHGLGDTGAIVVSPKTGGDRWVRLARTGPRVQERIGVGGGRVVWDEIRPNLRYAGASTAVIRLREPTGEVRDLAVGRLSAPALSPDGARVAAVWQSDEGRALLVELDAETGVRVAMYAAGDDGWAAPRYASDGASICAITQGRTGSAVVRVARSDGAVTAIAGPAPVRFADPACDADTVVYAADDGLYATDDAGTRNLEVFGASPAIDGDRLWFTTTSARGTELRVTPWPRSGTATGGFPGVGLGVGQGSPPWTERRVVRAARLFDAHGSLLSSPAGMTESGISGELWDVTGSTTWYGDAALDTNEGAPKLDLLARWSALPVRVGLAGRAGLRRYRDASEKVGSEAFVGAQLGVPLNLSRGVWTRTIDLDLQAGPVISRGWRPRFFRGEEPLADALIPTASASLVAAQSTLQAPRQVMPRWSQRLQVWGTTTDRGQFGAVHAAVTVPGFAPDQVVLVQFAAAHSTVHGWRPALPFRFSRGYWQVDQDALWRVSADWRFTLAYPDVSIGPLYVLRVKGGVFVDYAASASGRYRSAGLELVTDTSLLHLNPRDLGVRVFWRFDPPVGVGFGPVMSWRY